MRTILYTVKKKGENMIGTIYIPKGSGCGQNIKYCDAIEWGVPVEYYNKKKLITQERFNKILQKHLVDGKDLEGHCFEKCSFQNVSFSGLSLYNIIFKNCELVNCNFNDSRFHDGLFVDSTFTECDFVNATCYIDAKNTQFSKCVFSKVTIAQTIFDVCIFKNCNLIDSYLRNCSFFKCVLEQPDFTSATFNTVYFHECDIHKAAYDNIGITMGGATSEEVSIHRNLIMNALSMT